MVSSALYNRLPSRAAINSFKNSAPDIVGFGGASAEVRGYIDVPVQITEIEVTHTLLIVTDSPFALLIGMDILRPHAASLSVCHSTSLQFCNRVCAIWLERRVVTRQESQNVPAVDCAIEANIMPMLPLPPPLVSLSAPTLAPLAVSMTFSLSALTLTLFPPPVVSLLAPPTTTTSNRSRRRHAAVCADYADAAPFAVRKDFSSSDPPLRQPLIPLSASTFAPPGAPSPFAVRAVAPAAVHVVTVKRRRSRDWPRRELSSVC